MSFTISTLGQSADRARAREWLRLAGSLVVLATVIYLVQLAIFYTSKLGFELAPSTWQVVNTDDCAGDSCLQRGDRVRRIGTLDFDRFVQDRSRPLTADTDPIEIEFEREGQIHVVAYSRPSLPTVKRVARVCTLILAPIAFWFAGAAASLFLRPLGRRGSLYVVLFYILSLFFAAGWSGWSQVGYAWYFLRVAVWLLIPLLVHFHAEVAEVRWLAGTRAVAVYLLAAAGLLAELLLPGIGNLVAPTLLAAILLSGILLTFGWLRPDSPRRQRSCRIMSVGFFLGITPFVLTMVVPAIVPSMAGENSSAAEYLLSAVAILSIPLWPVSYLYAVHDADDRDLRFRANQWLGQYGFYSLTLTAFLGLQMFGMRVIWRAETAEASFELGYVLPLVACALLLLVAPAIKVHFQRWVDARVFGIRYEPEAVVRQFARSIPKVVDMPRLGDLLCHELLPTLMIQQSSLYLFSGDETTPVYVAAAEELPSAQILRWVAEEPDAATATSRLRASGVRWVRLVLPVTADERLLGIWLFGDRDPDDFYSADDVELLESLAGMIGAVIRGQQAATVREALLANVSHEMRTPLNGILGMTELADQSDELSPRLQEVCTTIHTSGETLLHLVDNLLNLAGAEASTTTLRRRSFDMWELLQRVVRSGSASARAKGLELRLDDDGIRGVFVGDDERIGRILDLLVSNAVKFTDRGEIVLGASRHADHGGMLRIWVSDTGIGIPATELERIFDSFTQLDPTMTRRHDGMGLGLAICHQLAQRLDGSVGVTSEEGKGSRFWLDVPLASAANDGGEVHGHGTRGGKTAGDSRQRRVLVAEDDLVNVLVVENMLDHIGCTVEVVGDGEQAVSKSFREAYDLVLMDCKMPIMNGLEATAKIRQREEQLELPRLPIVGFTAHALPEEIARCLQVGMDEVLLKPVRLEALQKVVQRRIT